MPCPECGHKYDDPKKKETCDECWANKLVKKMMAKMRAEEHLMEYDTNGDPVEPYCKGYRNLATHHRLREFFRG